MPGLDLKGKREDRYHHQKVEHIGRYLKFWKHSMFRQQQMVQLIRALRARWGWSFKKVSDHLKGNIFSTQLIFFHHKPAPHPDITFLSMRLSFSLLLKHEVSSLGLPQQLWWVLKSSHFDIQNTLSCIFFYFHCQHTAYHLISRLFHSCIIAPFCNFLS